ncbi:MAG: DUF2793 domain-containing protein [Pararhizobium sp.]
METTPRLSLPMIMPSQAQKHVTHNEALADLDALVQTAAESRAAMAPPAEPREGDVFIVPAGGSWQGAANDIALFSAGGWRFLTPHAGWRAYVEDEDDVLLFDGTDWASLVKSRLTGGPDLPYLGVAATADEANRLTVASPGVLFSHAGSDVRLALDKAGPADTASLLFQTGFSGRAEIGTAGSDALVVKVSPDGAAWKTSLSVDNVTGWLGLGTTTPGCPLEISGSLGRVSCPGFAAWAVAATGEGGHEYRLAATDDSNGLGGGKFVIYDQTDSIARLVLSASAIECGSPIRLPAIEVAGLPPASLSEAGALLYVSDAAGGGTVAFSDGTAWRRIADNAPLS